MRASEICVKQIRVNQGLGVFQKYFLAPLFTIIFWPKIIILVTNFFLTVETMVE